MNDSDGRSLTVAEARVSDWYHLPDHRAMIRQSIRDLAVHVVPEPHGGQRAAYVYIDGSCLHMDGEDAEVCTLADALRHGGLLHHMGLTWLLQSPYPDVRLAAVAAVATLAEQM